LDDPSPALPGILLTPLLIGLAVLILLILLSAVTSSLEVAIFSLKSDEKQLLLSEKIDERLKKLLDSDPFSTRILIGTLLLTSNILNISSVVATYYIGFKTLPLNPDNFWHFLLQSTVATLLIVVFAEVVPKHYAYHHRIKTIRWGYPLIGWLLRINYYPARMLASTTKFIDKTSEQRSASVSVHDLNQAIEIAFENDVTDLEERALLKGVVNFGTRTAAQIMQPHHKIVYLKESATLEEVHAFVAEQKFSRVPIRKDDYEEFTGVLHVKDLYFKPKQTWKSLVRPVFMVPETKKIDDLFRDMQLQRNHMAVVLNEYGEVEGLVTMEDVLEEIFGEINDEHDVVESWIKEISEQQWEVNASATLGDLVKHFHLREDYFAPFEGEVETLGGLILEIAKKIPNEGDCYQYEKLQLCIAKANDKKIEKVHLSM
jgi:CBS domain containing-hemolysin-like protein